MGEPTNQSFEVPSEWQTTREESFLAPGQFVQFPIEDVDGSIPDRFEKIVRLYPDRLAVKMGDRSLTYDVLNRYANRIARAILAKRAPGSEPIALLLEQGVEVIAAIVGVLKAAKFYVLLNSSTPRERTAYILEDSQAGLIITNTANLDLACALSGRTDCLNLDHFDAALGSDDLCLPILPGSLASILYTSGSTGKPKGVGHNHRSQLHTVMVNTNAARIGCQDKLTLLHSVGFGSAQAHVFQSLLNGASLNFFDVNNAGIPRLAKWLRDERISVYHSPPALFRELAAVMRGAEKLPHLRLIRLTGEAMTPADYELYKATFSPTALLQVVMNSTEANVISSFTTDGSFAFPALGSPCGYSVEGKEILLLDDDGREVARGEAGEIAVKSAYLPSGYWDERERSGLDSGTSSQNGKERTILTGDIGRIRADGFLIHMGRKDSMVKIRGFRVEIGEVERALLSHPLVKDAAVAAWERAPAEKYLVGYVVALRRWILTVGELRAFLANHLPDYMIPSTFVFLESLPLTNGKVERRALPAPDRSRPELATRYVAPRSELERQLVALWEEVLDVCPIGIDDDFFDLGGYSLLGAKLVDEIKHNLQVELPLPLLAEQPTIAQLAARIAMIRSGEWEPGKQSQAYRYLVKLQSAPDQTPVFCLSHAGNYRGDLLRFAQLNRLIGPPYCFYGIQARGADGTCQPHRSVEEMAAAYIEEIQAIKPRGPHFLIGECGAAPIAYEIARQLQARGDEVGLLILLDARGYGPFARGYFWRRYIWYRYLPWLCYPIQRVKQSQALKNLRRRTGFHFPELTWLKGTERLSYVFFNSTKMLRLIGSELGAGIRSARPARDSRQAGAAHHAKTREKRLTHSALLYPLFRMARLRYQYQPYSGKIAVVTNEEWYDADPTLGWPRLALGGLEVHKIAGNHDTYITRNVRAVAQVLRECLQRAESA